MLGMQHLCEQQDRHGKAIYVNEVHMAQIKQEQESINLDQWMQCNDHAKIAKGFNMLEQINMLLILYLICNEYGTKI